VQYGLSHAVDLLLALILALLEVDIGDDLLPAGLLAEFLVQLSELLLLLDVLTGTLVLFLFLATEELLELLGALLLAGILLVVLLLLARDQRTLF